MILPEIEKTRTVGGAADAAGDRANPLVISGRRVVRNSGLVTLVESNLAAVLRPLTTTFLSPATSTHE